MLLHLLIRCVPLGFVLAAGQRNDRYDAFFRVPDFPHPLCPSSAPPLPGTACPRITHIPSLWCTNARCKIIIILGICCPPHRRFHACFYITLALLWSVRSKRVARYSLPLPTSSVVSVKFMNASSGMHSVHGYTCKEQGCAPWRSGDDVHRHRQPRELLILSTRLVTLRMSDSLSSCGHVVRMVLSTV
ncbi:hypothetical protein OF83DRAFT_564340 [Amylostereum chailletii]|nr:hypothetical protein OF83DRAFT_564340 [Amylostereum chailletii]